ncbi:sensor histidine kinase [Dyadobacter sp. CY323]|uniref:sensor histidine kinase n=1 Tax=Dyadobacter sp. CY323 TaxID=2907302 RepID=UPI001F2ACC33|nr:sensor histidine kinase [Dyadobacter sp. CY323]MCE6987728.1 sensor histidine kinase [Dyadobacter sp. CY323]
MQKLYSLFFSFLILISSALLSGCQPNEARAVATARISPVNLTDLYAKAEEYVSAWPDSLLVVAEKMKEEGLRVHDKKAIVRGERYEAQARWRLGNHREAMRLAIHALSNAERWKLPAEIPDIYGVIGNLHKEKHNYDMAMSAVDNGMSVATEIGDTVSIIYMMRLKAMFTQGIGANTKDTALINRSLHMHLEGLKIAESSPRLERHRIGYYNNIAQVYVKRKEMDKALFYVSKGITLAKKYNQLLSLTYSYTWLSQVHLYNNDIEKATEYLGEALRIAQGLNNPFRQMEIYSYLYQALKSTSDYQQALLAYTRYSEIRDSLRVLENVRQVGELQVEYEAEKKDQQISALGLINETKTRETVWALVGLGTFLILSVFLIFQYRIILRNNENLKVNNQKIADQSEKMKVLMKELHHRVKNNLQTVSNLLSLQSNRLTDEDARQTILTGQQRIEAMSLIHKSLYNHDNANLVDMKEYMTNLVESVMQSFGVDEKELELNLTVGVERLDIDTAMPLGLIVNEWITNVFKHAYQDVEAPKLTVILDKREKLYLEMADNGPGIDMKTWERPGSSFGIKLVKILAKQLDGQCKVLIINGTKFVLEVPLSELSGAV